MPKTRISKKELRKMLLKELKREIPDFAKRVAPIYKILRWTWWGKEIPDKHRITKVLNQQMEDMTENVKNEGFSTGGLSIEIEYDAEDGSTVGMIGFTYKHRVYAYPDGELTKDVDMPKTEIEIAEARRRKIGVLIREARDLAEGCRLFPSGIDSARLIDDLADVAEEYLKVMKCQQK